MIFVHVNNHVKSISDLCANMHIMTAFSPEIGFVILAEATEAKPSVDDFVMVVE